MPDKFDFALYADTFRREAYLEIHNNHAVGRSELVEEKMERLEVEARKSSGRLNRLLKNWKHMEESEALNVAWSLGFTRAARSILGPMLYSLRQTGLIRPLTLGIVSGLFGNLDDDLEAFFIELRWVLAKQISTEAVRSEWAYVRNVLPQLLLAARTLHRLKRTITQAEVHIAAPWAVFYRSSEKHQGEECRRCKRFVATEDCSLFFRTGIKPAERYSLPTGYFWCGSRPRV